MFSTGYGTHPVSCSVHIGSTFSRLKQTGRESDPHLHVVQRLGIEVAVSPHCHIHVPSCHGSGTNLPLLKLRAGLFIVAVL